MLKDKIEEIELEKQAYYLLYLESKNCEEKARYKGVLQGFDVALSILNETNFRECGICPICREYITNVAGTTVDSGNFTYHASCYEKED